jgi:hypothetical protein
MGEETYFSHLLSFSIRSITQVDSKSSSYRWFEAVPPRCGKDAMLVNWIGFEIVGAKDRVKYSMAWIASLPVTKQPSRHQTKCRRNRRLRQTRWKIENEGFNAMKNHGYEFEHNFGHGKRFLAASSTSFCLRRLGRRRRRC